MSSRIPRKGSTGLFWLSCGVRYTMSRDDGKAVITTLHVSCISSFVIRRKCQSTWGLKPLRYPTHSTRVHHQKGPSAYVMFEAKRFTAESHLNGVTLKAVTLPRLAPPIREQRFISAPVWYK